MYVGLDVHKRVCYGTVMDEKGKIVKQAKFTNDLKALDEFMEDLDEALVAMEAGYCWQSLYDRLEETGYDVRLAHPLKVFDAGNDVRPRHCCLRVGPRNLGLGLG